jgi:hypothetical protein
MTIFVGILKKNIPNKLALMGPWPVFSAHIRHGEQGAPVQESRPDLFTSSVVTQPSRSALCRNDDGLIKRRGARFQPANISEACRMQCLVQV